MTRARSTPGKGPRHDLPERGFPAAFDLVEVFQFAAGGQLVNRGAVAERAGEDDLRCGGKVGDRRTLTGDALDVVGQKARRELHDGIIVGVHHDGGAGLGRDEGEAIGVWGRSGEFGRGQEPGGGQKENEACQMQHEVLADGHEEQRPQRLVSAWNGASVGQYSA